MRSKPRYQFGTVRLEDVDVSQWNARQREVRLDVDELARSLELHGLQQPIVVQPKDGKYEILIGQRRYLAARHLGWEEIDAKILDEPIGEQAAKLASFSENIQRRELAPRDKADACQYLLGVLGSVRAVAEELAISEPTVRKWLGYSAVPPAVKELVETHQLTVPQAIRVSEVSSTPERAGELAEAIVRVGPAKEERDRILQVAEVSPNSPIDAIMRRAREQRERRVITFVLPEQYHVAMDTAARDTQKEAGEIARDATLEWLTNRYG